ncbi:MAG: flagellar biosynthesis anti-sigma factor FlgM [Candidatus Poribacteria bacterium]|nr:flagellar biosynthesis anti-sigma factor FlgM [Candidatus Poribacteria bacterium]
MIIDRNRLKGYSGVRGVSRTPYMRKDGGGSQVEGVASNPSSEVQVSKEALLFTRLKEQLRNLPEIREDRVEAVRQKLLNGEFAVDSEDLVEKLTGGDSR